MASLLATGSSADMSGFGVPADAARLPFGLSDTTDPLGGLGRLPDRLDDRIRGDFDTPIYRLTPGTQPGPLEAAIPVPPVESPPPQPRPRMSGRGD